MLRDSDSGDLAFLRWQFREMETEKKANRNVKRTQESSASATGETGEEPPFYSRLGSTHTLGHVTPCGERERRTPQSGKQCVSRGRICGQERELSEMCKCRVGFASSHVRSTRPVGSLPPRRSRDTCGKRRRKKIRLTWNSCRCSLRSKATAVHVFVFTSVPCQDKKCAQG